MKKISLLNIFLILIVFGNCKQLFSYNAKKNPPKKDNYNLRVGDIQFFRSYLENGFKEHPMIFTATSAAIISSYLYPAEIKKTIEDYRNQICMASFAALGLLYYHKAKIIESINNDTPQEDDNEHDTMLNFSQCGVRIFSPGDILTRFKDVAGLETAQEDLMDIVSFLKDSSKFTSIGAHVPKGILLSGAPGNGKTLLARALAGETKCPFLYINASEFIEAIVGRGAARVRHLFEIAKELAPCIIFIDEIDAIGCKRSSHGLGGDTELSQTLNQLLAEMDGFEQQATPIIIIGATNRAEVLDQALLRPGRFDRKIEIGLPFKKDRINILKVHFKNIKTSPNIDIEKIASGTIGFSGAELAQLVNEAAILAIREGQTFVTMHHVDQARDYMLMGRETKGMEISTQDYWQTAIHEAGHALAHVYQPYAIPLYKVTITPRGHALGITSGIPCKERLSHFEHEMRAEIVTALAGSVAEEIMHIGRSTGTSSDLIQARQLATNMVMRYGMTKEFKDVTFAEFIHDQIHLPNEIATKLHNEVSTIISECRAIAYQILTEHQDKLLQLIDMLMEEGTVFGSDVYQLCNIQEPENIDSLTKR